MVDSKQILINTTVRPDTYFTSFESCQHPMTFLQSNLCQKLIQSCTDSFFWIMFLTVFNYNALCYSLHDTVKTKNSTLNIMLAKFLRFEVVKSVSKTVAIPSKI
jgi:hypothetical protein